MTELDVAQGELSLARPGRSMSVPVEMIRTRKSAAAAFTLACDVSGLEDKEIYMALAIDAGYFSRIKKGNASLDADRIAKFCQIVGNTIYPEWIAYQVHCGLVLLKTEAERRAEQAEASLEREREKVRLLEGILRGVHAQ